MIKRTGWVFVFLSFIVASSFLVSLRMAESEGKVLEGEEVFRTDCNAGFVRNQCVTCHDLQGRGALRQNLTPTGLDYFGRNLGCIANLTTIKGQKDVGVHRPLPDRISLVRKHFQQFNCLKCHNIDGEGTTRANLTEYGFAMHEAGMGCIVCLNAIKKQAGRTDLLTRPNYE
jgi:cytochrome c553